MARKKAPTKPELTDDAKLVARVRKRYRVMVDADHKNRQEAMEDFKFVNQPGYQWDALTRQYRGDRPCYEFNELRLKGKRIINDMRANRPAAKVRGYEDSDVDTADILEGLGRNIWNNSDADTIIDNAGEYQVNAGMGCWRVTTDYETPKSMDQDIYVEAIKNPFCLYCDPAAQDPMQRDADDWILTERIPRATYEARWPKKAVVDFDDVEWDDEEDWQDDETVRICEYWWKEPYDAELWQLPDGKVIDSKAPEAAQLASQVVKKRTVKSHKIMMCIVSGDAVLDKPTVCAGHEHRFVMVYGEQMVIEGKNRWWGLPRFAKDAQKNLNITITAAIESTVASLQSKYWVTPKQAEGNLEKWGESIKKNIPFALYNHDPLAPGPPQRVGGADVPIALMELSQQAHGLINTTTGIFEASQGAPSNEQTGRAILARQQQGEIATYNFQDNMTKGVLRTWEIFLDLIPEVIDTERAVRILGPDGAEKYMKVNQFVPNPNDPMNPIKVNDLSQGRYDVTVTAGPNFATRRQEAAETWQQMAQADPLLMQTAPDLVYKSMDVPYSDDIAERRRAMLPPPILQMLQQDKPPPPEVQAAMAQVQAMQEQVTQHGQLVEAAQKELEQEKTQADQSKAGLQVASAQLDAKQAKFDADIDKQLSALAVATANLKALQATAVAEMGNDNALADREALAKEVRDAVLEMKSMQVDALGQLQSKLQPQVIVPPAAPRPRIVAVHSSRQNGGMVSTPVYEDQQAPSNAAPADMSAMMPNGSMSKGMPPNGMSA